MRAKDGHMLGIQGISYEGIIPREACLPLVKRYTCVYCDSVFGLKFFLKQHYREKHREAIPDFAEYLRRSYARIVMRRFL